MTEFNLEEEAKKCLLDGYRKAAKLLKENQHVVDLYSKAERKHKGSGTEGKQGVYVEIPNWISLGRNYLNGKYSDVTISVIINIVSALDYYVTGQTVIAGVGAIHDEAVLKACDAEIHDEVQKFLDWKN